MSDIEGGLGAQVDYQERFSAAGRIPHNAQRRELAPSSTEIGRAQSVQCALEPLFAKGFAGRCQASPRLRILNAICLMLQADQCRISLAASRCISDVQ